MTSSLLTFLIDQLKTIQEYLLVIIYVYKLCVQPIISFEEKCERVSDA